MFKCENSRRQLTKQWPSRCFVFVPRKALEVLYGRNIGFRSGNDSILSIFFHVFVRQTKIPPGQREESWNHFFFLWIWKDFFSSLASRLAKMMLRIRKRKMKTNMMREERSGPMLAVPKKSILYPKLSSMRFMTESTL
mgnify:CR=1 FL=1